MTRHFNSRQQQIIALIALLYSALKLFSVAYAVPQLIPCIKQSTHRWCAVHCWLSFGQGVC